MRNYTPSLKNFENAKSIEALHITKAEFNQLDRIQTSAAHLTDFAWDLLLTKKVGFEFKNLAGAAYKKSLVTVDRHGMTNTSFEAHGQRFNLSEVASLDEALNDEDDSLTLADMLGSQDPAETYAATQTLSDCLSEVCDLLAGGTAAIQALPLSLTTGKKVGTRQAQKLVKKQIERATQNRDLFFDEVKGGI